MIAGSSCLLGSINLSEFVINPFTEESDIDYKSLRRVVCIAVTALNDVLDEGIEKHPLAIQQNTVRDFRQIGLGTMGLADMLIKLQVTYGSNVSLNVIDNLYQCISETALEMSAVLAKNFGKFPSKKVTIEDLLNSSFVQEGNYSDKVLNKIKTYGLRNSQILTCAPTGSIATMLGVSTGVEPIYAMKYNRTTKSLVGKDKTYEVYTPIAEEYLKNHKELSEHFVESKDIASIDRIKVQSVLQKYIDASISSTINLPENTTVDEIRDIYIYSWKHGLKGVTVFRSGCARTAILTTKKEEETSKETNFNYITPISRKVLGTTCGKTFCNKSACGTLYVTCNSDCKGNFVELFTHTSKGGVCQANLNAVTRGISLALRSGIRVDEIIDQLKGIHCPACSMAKAKGNPVDGLSCPDIIAKVMTEFENKEAIVEDSGDKCPECGKSTLRHEGGCVTCTSCGWSKCN